MDVTLWSRTFVQRMCGFNSLVLGRKETRVALLLRMLFSTVSHLTLGANLLFALHI